MEEGYNQTFTWSEEGAPDEDPNALRKKSASGPRSGITLFILVSFRGTDLTESEKHSSNQVGGGHLVCIIMRCEYYPESYTHINP